MSTGTGLSRNAKELDQDRGMWGATAFLLAATFGILLGHTIGTFVEWNHGVKEPVVLDTQLIRSNVFFFGNRIYRDKHASDPFPVNIGGVNTNYFIGATIYQASVMEPVIVHAPDDELVHVYLWGCPPANYTTKATPYQPTKAQ